MKNIIYICAVTLMVIVGFTSGKKDFEWYEESPEVVTLTPQNFDRLVTNSNKVWVVQFYIRRCRYCKRLAPEFKETAISLKGKVKMGVVEGNTESAVLKQRFGVTGFPTLLVFGADKTQEPIKYRKRRTKEVMYDHFHSYVRARH